MKNYTLPKEFGEKWVEALNNPENKQTVFKYKDGDCYCAVCLGYNANGFLFISNELVDEFQKDLLYKYNYPLWCVITSLNDTDGKTFPEIAQWITKNVELV